MVSRDPPAPADDAPRRRRRRDAPPVLGPWLEYRPSMPIADPPMRVLIGCMVLAIAVAATFARSLGRLSYWMLLIGGFGIGMAVSGILQQRHEQRIRRELRRAAKEWPSLLRDACATRGVGGAIPRLLQQRGYRDYFLRRWLAARLARTLADATRSEH